MKKKYFEYTVNKDFALQKLYITLGERNALRREVI